MTARDELTALYEEWRHWTVAEASAMEAGDWHRVEQCQTAKLELQPRIARATELLQRETGGRPPRQAADESHFRAVINELIQLEQRNNELLSAQRRGAERNRDDLDLARRNLKQLQQAYVAHAESGPVWHSYS